MLILGFEFCVPRYSSTNGTPTRNQKRETRNNHGAVHDSKTMVAILGGGIAGLSAAFELHQQGIDFELFEASDRVGGKIQSERIKGFMVEHGPNSLQASSPFLERVIATCGLKEYQIFADESAKKRYVVRNSVPMALPGSPPALLSSDFFSWRTKLRLAREPFISRHQGSEEESVAEFVRRRMGQEVLDYAVDPFVTGIFAGNPELLAIKHAFPTLFGMEHDNGSILRGLLSRKKQANSSPSRHIFTFSEGVQMLPDAMARLFSDRIHTRKKVKAIVPTGKRWRIDTLEGNHEESRNFDAVISTIPLPHLAKISLDVNLDLTPFHNVSYPPVSIVVMGFEGSAIAHPLDGFGLLVPKKEQSKRILGTIFSSSVFPSHAPAGHTLLTSMIGGARQPDMSRLTIDLLEYFVLDDLHELLGIYGDPVLIQHIHWKQAIPQYNLGYGVVKALINNLEATHSGLFFAGNYRQGISLTHAMESGHDVATRVHKLLNK